MSKLKLFQKATSFALAFLLILQTITGLLLPVDIKLLS